MSVEDVLRVASAEIGYTRWNDPNTGTKYGRWYADMSRVSWYGNNGIAYCAMFVSWVYAQCPNDSIPGGPKAYVPYFINEARTAGAIVPFDAAQPADLICFDWDDDGVADHVGIVASAPSGNTISTIEGNTSPGTMGSQGDGGGVYARTRYRGEVIAVIRTTHSKGAQGNAKTSQTSNNNDILKVVNSMKATHIFFETGGRTCVANVLAGTWRSLPDGEAYARAKLALSRSGAIVKSWKDLGASSNHVDDPEDAFGKRVN